MRNDIWTAAIIRMIAMAQIATLREERPVFSAPKINPSLLREFGGRSLTPTSAQPLVAAVANSGNEPDDKIEASLSFIRGAEETIATIERRLDDLMSEVSRLKGSLQETTSERDLLSERLKESELAFAAQTERCEKADRLIREHEMRSNKVAEQLNVVHKKVSVLTAEIAIFGSAG